MPDRAAKYEVSWLDEGCTLHSKEFTNRHEAFEFKQELRLKASSQKLWNINLWDYMQCDCGEWITLQGDTQCDNCEQWYNGFGQKLRDPSQWEERIDADY